MDKIQKKPQVWILSFLFSLANVLGVMFVAALPELTEYFQITKGKAQDTISIYLLGCMVAQVIYPSLAKSFGRKASIYIGGSLAIVGSVLCLISLEMSSYSLLLFGRGIMALGAACGAILVSTIVAESFSVHETRKKFSHLFSSFIVFPSIGIVIGGFLTKYISWESCFYFMLLYSIFVVLLCIWVPETGKDNSLSHLHIVKIAKSYIQQFSNVTGLLYGLIAACACIFLYVFAAEAPFLAQEQLNISAEHFGLYNLIPNVGFFVGGLFSAHLIHRITSRTLVLIGVSGFTLFSVIMWLIFDMGFVNPLTLFGIPFFIFLSAAAILPNSQACALARAEDKPYMSSLLYVIQYLWVAMSIVALRLLPAEDPSVLPIMYSCSAGLMIILLCVVRKFYTKPCS